MSILSYKNFYTTPDLIIAQSTPHDRFEFQQIPGTNALELMLTRFLSEYGPQIPENDPADVLVVSFDHTQTSNNHHHLNIEYQMEGIGYQVEVQFNYFPSPNPDFFTDVAFEDLATYTMSFNILT